MTRFVLRWAINAAALYAAIYLLQGNGLTLHGSIQQNWPSFLLLALVFGLINALLRPILVALTCPLIILTLGLGTLVINTFLFYLAGIIGDTVGFGYTVNNFLTAFLGALIVSIVSFVLNLVLREELKRTR